jgi:signal transduction histidine kinase
VPVVGDRVRLGQVLSNLLHNAVKFTPRGGRVEVQLAPAERHATLRVADSGMGIESHLLAQLFEPFRQGEDASAPSNPGLGLGLALARALIEMHGGHIVAHSDGHGHGAEFVVTLPLEGAVSSVADPRRFVDTGRHRGIVSEDFEPRGE